MPNNLLTIIIPFLIIVLSVLNYQFGLGAAFWFYPLIMAIFIALPLKRAFAMSALVLGINLPIFFTGLDLATAIRLSISLALIGVFCTVFLGIVNSQRQRILENEQMREAQTANTLHELKNPLATMLAKIEAMRDGIRPVNDEQLGSLISTNTYFSKLVDDLKLLSQADVSDLKLNKQDTDVSQLIEEVGRSYSKNFSESNILLTTHAEQRVSLKIDPLRIRQVLDNLMSNCVKYASEGGEVNLSLMLREDVLEIRVEDSGPGVEERHISQLFERFYREDNDRVQQKNGSGLGLSIARSLVEMHGGQISAFSSSLGGLGIRITLPRNASDG